MALESGWRDHVFERVIPVWEPLRGNPHYESIMQQVRDDVERQRALVSNRHDPAQLEVAVLLKAAEGR